MSDDPTGRTYESRALQCSFQFSTYSDAKLARLFLDNDIPIVLFKKVLDVILDPAFKSDEVTFKDVWDMFFYISGRRRKDASKRGSTVTTQGITEPTTTPSLPSVVPPLVLDLVVDRLIEDRTPLGVAAIDPWATNAFESNMEPFHNMSLVHRSWTHIAQRGLRHRVIVPYQHISNFLLNPLCGPWINEMIIYWSVENGHIGVTKGDVWLLEALLERTPNVRSLAFNTSLIWPRGDFLRPSFDVDICLEIISDLLPNLANLWLKHVQPPISEYEKRLDTCCDVRHLCRQVPKLHALEFLSLRSWSSNMDGEWLSQGQPDLDWNLHPPSQLNAIELDLSGGLHKEDLTWLINPRKDFCLQSISITSRNQLLQEWDHLTLREALRDCIHQVKSLRLCIFGAPDMRRRWVSGDGAFVPFYNDLLLNSSKLVSLDVFLMDEGVLNPSSLPLPPCLGRLGVHFHGDSLQHQLAPTATPSQFVQDLQKCIATLPHLQNILMTGSRKLPAEIAEYWDLDGFIHHMNEYAEPYRESIPEMLSNICMERCIRLTIVTDASLVDGISHGEVVAFNMVSALVPLRWLPSYSSK